jgi:hypothetical protein
MFTNNNDIIINVAVDPVSCSNKSDHHLLILDIYKHHTRHSKVKCKLAYSKANFTEIRKAIHFHFSTVPQPYLMDLNQVWSLAKNATSMHAKDILLPSKFPITALRNASMKKFTTQSTASNLPGVAYSTNRLNKRKQNYNTWKNALRHK